MFEAEVYSNFSAAVVVLKLEMHECLPVLAQTLALFSYDFYFSKGTAPGFHAHSCFSNCKLLNSAKLFRFVLCLPSTFSKIATLYGTVETATVYQTGFLT